MVKISGKYVFMTKSIKNLITSALFILIIVPGVAQDGTFVQKNLINTWYKVKVGNADSGEMRTSQNKEVYTFNANGVVTIETNQISFEATWEYLEDSQEIKCVANIQGREEQVIFKLLELTDSKLVLVGRGIATEYGLTPPDPDAQQDRTAPLVVNSDSTINVSEWSGLHPFNTKITTTSNNQKSQQGAIGVLVLLNINGKKIIRINEDGLTTDIPVLEPTKIGGQMHFGLITEDPELAGEVVFREDNSFYFYRDTNQDIVEYFKQ